MHYLLCHLVMTVSFSQLFHCVQQRRGNVVATVAVNYAVAMVLSGGWLLLAGGPIEKIPWTLITRGLVNGSLYSAHLLLVLASFRIAGVGITVALIFAGSIGPVLAAWALWDETITPAQWLTTSLLLPVLVLMRPARDRDRPHRRLTLKADLVLLLVFLGAAVIQSIHKSVEVHATVATKPVYNLTLYTMAAITSLGYALWRRLPVRRLEIAAGSLLGLFNTLNLILVLLALSVLPAAVFFPISSTLIVAVNLALSRLFWHERITRRQAAGLILALAMVFLVRLNGW